MKVDVSDHFSVFLVNEPSQTDLSEKYHQTCVSSKTIEEFKMLLGEVN